MPEDSSTAVKNWQEVVCTGRFAAKHTRALQIDAQNSAVIAAIQSLAMDGVSVGPLTLARPDKGDKAFVVAADEESIGRLFHQCQRDYIPTDGLVFATCPGDSAGVDKGELWGRAANKYWPYDQRSKVVRVAFRPGQPKITIEVTPYNQGVVGEPTKYDTVDEFRRAYASDGGVLGALKPAIKAALRAMTWRTCDMFEPNAIILIASFEVDKQWRLVKVTRPRGGMASAKLVGVRVTEDGLVYDEETAFPSIPACRTHLETLGESALQALSRCQDSLQRLDARFQERQQQCGDRRDHRHQSNRDHRHHGGGQKRPGDRRHQPGGGQHSSRRPTPTTFCDQGSFTTMADALAASAKPLSEGAGPSDAQPEEPVQDEEPVVQDEEPVQFESSGSRPSSGPRDGRDHRRQPNWEDDGRGHGRRKRGRDE
jgi:hypothetical protein